MGIGSYEQGRVSLHGNASLIRGGVSDEFTWAGAASVAASPRVTIAGEVLARHVTDLHDIDLVVAPHPTIAGVDTLRLAAGETATTLANAVAGVKWNITGMLVLGGHVAFPLLKHGLTAGITPTFGLEYAF
jgi:hypothetical protein